MEDQPLVEEKPVNKNRTWIIAVVVVIVLCCCCVASAGAGYYFYISNRSADVTVPPFQLEEAPSQSGFDGGEPPSGGLANDILKEDTWRVMSVGAVSFGCEQPSGAGLTIEVLQEPDSAGVWIEKWPVQCASGDTYNFEVEFILDDTGTTFNIRLMD